MAARTARAESIRPGDTVLLPAYAQSDMNGAHVGKVRFLLCVAWCVPRGLSAHLQPATGTQVHCDLTPPATTPGRAHSSSPVTSSSNPLRRFASRTCAFVDLVSVPTQHAETVELVYATALGEALPATSLKARVLDLLHGCVVARGFTVELGPAGCLGALRVCVTSTYPASCAVKIHRRSTRVVLLREGDSSVDANSVSYSSALSPARSLTVPHPTHDQVSRTGSADPVLRGPAKELCELIEAPVIWADHLFTFYKDHLRLPRGVLLSGPPGVGKTRAVRLACSHRNPRVKLRLFSVAGADIFTATSLGGAEAVLRTVFNKAREHCASGDNAVSVVFIDEIDVVCPKRDGGQGSGSSAENVRVVSQLLTLLDGVRVHASGTASEVGTTGDAAATAQFSERRLIVVAATNRPNVLDPALRRPGRFDREIRFPPPDEVERLVILKGMVSTPEEDDGASSRDVDSERQSVSAAAAVGTVSTAATATTRVARDMYRQDSTSTSTCPHYLHAGTCKFGHMCRFMHDRTLAMWALPLHAHPLGPDDKTKRKRNFCDICSKKVKGGGWRCTVGCDFDACKKCFARCAETRPIDAPGTKDTISIMAASTASVGAHQLEPKRHSTAKKKVPLRSWDGPGNCPILANVAQRAVGFTGADLQSLVREAAMHAVTQQRQYVDASDFDHAFTLVSGPSSGRGRRIAINNRGGKDHGNTYAWENLGGLRRAKLELQKAVVWPVERAGAFVRLGAKPPRGILLYGPPGCGKTSLVMATAAAAGATTFLTLTPSDVYSAYVGDSEAAVRAAFKHARDCLPALLFLDELDAIVGNRGLEGSGGGSDSIGVSDVQSRVLSTLLNEMDGIVAANGLIIVAATNRLDAIDPALLRPGRFGCHIAVELPDAKERQDIIRVSCKRIPVAGTDDERRALYARLAARTEGCSAAELGSMCREAAMVALRGGRMEVEAGDFRV